MRRPRLRPTTYASASALHRLVFNILQEAFPGYTILESVHLEAGFNRTLEVDICVQEIKLCVECQGRQHFEFVQHFHKDMQAFQDQQRRDVVKAEQIKRLGYNLLIVRYDEVKQLTRRKLVSKIKDLMKEEPHVEEISEF